jgi:hypothetical protein
VTITNTPVHELLAEYTCTDVLNEEIQAQLSTAHDRTIALAAEKLMGLD